MSWKRRGIILLAVGLLVGVIVGYGIGFAVYQPELSRLQAALEQVDEPRSLMLYICDATVFYIKERHPDAGSYIPDTISWTGGRITPEGLVGHETYEYRGGGWKVTVGWAVVAPWEQTYEVRAEHEGITWTGIMRRGVVTETSYESKLPSAYEIRCPRCSSLNVETPVGSRSENFLWKCNNCSYSWHHTYPEDVYGKWRQSRMAEQEQAVDTALNFLLNSPTFKWDGVKDSVEVVQVSGAAYPVSTWVVEIKFTCFHGGYGDRTGKVVVQVLTDHLARITVQEGEVVSAYIDDSWDELNQKPL